MKAKDLKAGQKVQMIDCRKGTIIGIVKDNSDSEWLKLYLLKPVQGIITDWEEGEEITLRKSFLSSIKLLEASKKKEKIIFPIDKWGKDHWSLLAYCECRTVDHDGILDLVHIRINVTKRSFSNGTIASATQKWNPDWSTRLKSRKKPDKTHDDIDVLDDLQREEFLTYTFKCGNCKITLTEKGRETATEIREHKSRGKNFNEFKLAKKQLA